MSTPEQIRNSSEAIQKLYADMNKPLEPAPTSGNDPQKVAPTTEQVVSVNKPEETFEQKYRTLQGMYNKDVPRLSAENKALNQRVAQLEGLMASMNTRSAPSPQPQVKRVTDKDREEYGESIDVMRRVADEETSALKGKIGHLEQTLSELQTTVLPRVEQLTAHANSSSEQGFWSALGQIVPDWREVNDSPEFQSWLLEIDPLTNLSRQAYLEDAQRKLDATRVANFFMLWKSGSAGQVARTTTVTNNPQDELQRQVAPGRSMSSPAPQPNTGRSFTRAEIKQFYTDVSTGKFKGREDDRNQIEREIFAAQQNGRVA